MKDCHSYEELWADWRRQIYSDKHDSEYQRCYRALITHMSTCEQCVTEIVAARMSR